ncbi:MAG: glycosyltransferase [Planctomycetota bacterium]|nr:MAG: glycosyltransferase [Planctomycetota bacterium]
MTTMKPSLSKASSTAPGADAAPQPPRPNADHPLRVLQLLHTVAYGGIETILINWLTKLDPDRVDATLVVFANPGATEQAFLDVAQQRGLDALKIPWARRKPVFTAARALARIIRQRDIQIVHCHNVYAELVGYLAARWTGAKVMNTLYVWSDFGFKRNVQQWLSARLIRRFDMVTNQCAVTQRETIRRGVPQHKQRILVSGVEPPDLAACDAQRNQIRRQMGCNDEHIVLVNVARLYPEKRQDLLLDWFARIVDQRPQARLWLLGTGPLEQQLRRQIDALQLADTVAMPGFVTNLAHTLRAADIQVHTSDAEGVPLAICEGMAAAMPIVATAVGGVPEMITHEVSGLLVPARDGETFVQQTIRLIDDAQERRRLSRGARDFIEREYSLDVAVDRLARAYEDLLGRCARTSAP